ncbi:MAG: DUF1624 domain-containing protein, partial [Candidatus Acetothermia bacterium]
VNLYSSGLELAADATAANFFVLVGLSLYISYSRRKAQRLTRRELTRKYLSRGIKAFLLGVLITLVTYVLYPEAPILFGALHFIGTSIIIGYGALAATERRNRAIRFSFFLAIAAVCFGITLLLGGVNLDSALLLWVGVSPVSFQSLDYFPLVPWFGFVSLGLSFGPILYPDGKRRFSIPNFTNPFSTLLGRHALVIYILHQPLLYAAIFAYLRVSN